MKAIHLHCEGCTAALPMTQNTRADLQRHIPMLVICGMRLQIQRHIPMLVICGMRLQIHSNRFFHVVHLFSITNRQHSLGFACNASVSLSQTGTLGAAQVLEP